MQLRAENLGLIDASTGKTDTAILELYVWQSLIDISEVTDVPSMMRHDTTLFTTDVGVSEYRLPEDFGRLIMQRVRNRRGVYIFDGVQQFDLEYTDINVLARQYSAVNSRPRQFTVIERTLKLFPAPDSNSGLHYTVRGVYVVRQERPALDDEVILPYPGMIVDIGLNRYATDMGRPIQSLAESRAEHMARLAIGSR